MSAKVLREKSAGTSQQSPQIFVVTPYFEEDVVALRRCHDSVLGQRVDARIRHIMVADGHARDELDAWDIEHVRLPRPHGDYGNTPRAVGAVLAAAEGADFVAWLDADNWFQPEHLATMLDAHRQANASVVCCWRDFHTPDGERLPIVEFNERDMKHVDTNCLLIHRTAFGLNDIWTNMPRQLTRIGDRVFFVGVQSRNLSVCFTRRRTVAYATLYASHYVAARRQPPANAKSDNFSEERAYLESDAGARDTVRRLGFAVRAS